MCSSAILIRRAYFEAKKRRKYAKNVVVSRSAENHYVGVLKCRPIRNIGTISISYIFDFTKVNKHLN